MAPIFAYVNHGRWLARCPKCGAANKLADLGAKDKPTTLICRGCHPAAHNAMARALKPGHESKLKAMLEGDRKAARSLLWVDVPDLEERATQKRMARQAGEEYEVIYPKDAVKAEDVLRLRRVKNMNWLPESETLAELKRQNLENKIGVK